MQEITTAKRPAKPGTISEPYIACKTHRGAIVGRVTRGSSSANVSRFPGMGMGATLKRGARGALEWRGKTPKPVK